MESDIRETVIRVLAGHFGLPKHQLLTGAPFSDLGVDSLDHWEIIMTVEEHFNLNIPFEDAIALSTLGQLIAYVRNHEVAS
jgi:acyl carrier protein